MKRGKTKEGFEFEVNERVLKDMEFLDILHDVVSGDDEKAVNAYPELLNKILGKEQKQKLYDFIRDSEGIVSIEAVSEVVKQIIAQVKEIKN